MVQTHLYARNPETQVYSSPSEDGRPAFTVHQGSWMGVLAVSGSWIHVLTVAGEGWVQCEYTEERTPGELHIILMEDQTVEYVNSLSSGR